MMRNVLTGIMLAAGMAAVAAPAQAQTIKVGYINSQQIIAEAPGATEARNAFESEMGKARQQMQVLEDSLKNMIADYEKQQVMLSPDAKKQREDAIRARQTTYQQRAAALEEEMGKKQDALVRPIMARIEQVISDIRKEGGYAVIFDQAAGGLVAADPALDLTAKVLERLKATASAAPATPGRP